MANSASNTSDKEMRTHGVRCSLELDTFDIYHVHKPPLQLCVEHPCGRREGIRKAAHVEFNQHDLLGMQRMRPCDTMGMGHGLLGDIRRC